MAESRNAQLKMGMLVPILFFQKIVSYFLINLINTPKNINFL